MAGVFAFRLEFYGKGGHGPLKKLIFPSEKPWPVQRPGCIAGPTICSHSTISFRLSRGDTVREVLESAEKSLDNSNQLKSVRNLVTE